MARIKLERYREYYDRCDSLKKKLDEINHSSLKGIGMLLRGIKGTKGIDDLTANIFNDDSDYRPYWILRLNEEGYMMLRSEWRVRIDQAQ